jgi:8-oxo-dGTP pyrophosphatase MutT (NUDIX family)
MDFELLAERYAAHADVVRRAGRTHPAAIEPRPDVLIRLSDGDAPVDGALQAGGEAHLARVRARVPWMYDGAVLALDRIEGGVVHVRRCGYFDRIRTGDALVEDPRQRARAEELAGPDPLRCGVGRAAALGVSAACTVRVDGGRAVVLGRRGGMPIDAGGWHVVPSGMLEEPDPRAAIAAELREELGVEVDPSAFVVTGLGWDLLRLIPEVCFRIDLDVDGADLRPDGEEHDELRLVPLDGLDAFWAAQPPGTLTAPGVAALALAGL